MNIERLSLDQMHAFALAAEMGSLSAVARRLDRAQSAVSYAVTTLEEQLETRLFDRTGHKPQVTAEGRALLHDVRVILSRTDRLVSCAQSMQRPVESAIALAIEVMFPVDVLAAILRAFRDAYPAVGLTLRMEALGAVAHDVLEGRAQLGVVSARMEPPGLRSIALPHICMVPVAAPFHPLSKIAGRISEEQLQEHVQLVLSDRSPLSRGIEHDVFSPQSWWMSDLSTKHALLLAGHGFGTMPEHIVRADLEAGRLTRLLLQPHPPDGNLQAMSCIHRRDASVGPAMGWLIERFAALQRYTP